MIRLLSRRNWGTWKSVLEIPENKKAQAEIWALEGNLLDPAAQFRFEETSGKLIKDRLFEFFNSFRRAK